MIDLNHERERLLSKIGYESIYEISGVESEYGASLNAYDCEHVSFHKTGTSDCKFSVYCGSRKFTDENYISSATDYHRIRKEHGFFSYWTTSRVLAESLVKVINRRQS